VNAQGPHRQSWDAAHPDSPAQAIGAAIGNSVVGQAAFQGNIDELRISDVAIPPSQFLNVTPEPTSLALFTLGGAVFVRRRHCRPVR
jgi:hypothetical protein